MIHTFIQGLNPHVQQLARRKLTEKQKITLQKPAIYTRTMDYKEDGTRYATTEPTADSSTNRNRRGRGSSNPSGAKTHPINAVDVTSNPRKFP